MAERHTDELDRLMAPAPTEVAVARMYLLKERVGVLLDVAWMLAICGGLAWSLWGPMGAGGLIVGGALLAVFTQAAGWLRDREPKAEPAPDLIAPKSLPGPKDAGNVHISGG